MTTTQINNGATFNFETIKYAPVKTNSLGGKNVKILDPVTKEWLIISTPLMLSFGINDYVDPQTGVGNGKYELSQLFPNREYESEETRMFLENMKMFENKIKQDALKNSKEWFGKVHKSAEVVEALWTPMLKYSKNKDSGEYNLDNPPYIRSKVPRYDGKWNVEVFSEDGELIFPDDRNSSLTPLELFPPKKKCNIATVLLCGGIWFTNGKFTVTWELSQVVAQKPRERLLGQRKCLIHLKPSDIEKLKSQALEDENIEEEKVKKPAHLEEDSDNENAEEDDDGSKAQEPVEEVVVNAAEVVEAVSEAQSVDSKKKRIVKKKGTA